MVLYVNEAVIAHSFLALKAEKTSLPYALRTIHSFDLLQLPLLVNTATWCCVVILEEN